MDRHALAEPPRRPLAWPPYLWSRVLFPGQATTPPQPAQPAALLLLILLPGLLLYPCLRFRLFEPDEGRYAEIPREMLQRGEWVVPYLQGEPYLDKPPLLYWLVEGSYLLFGAHDWSARLVPALALHACVLLTYLLGKRSLGERAAFAGALALGLAPGFISVGRLLLLDGLLALWTTLALLAAFEALRGERLRWGWWLLSAAACGLGVLTKGPVALVLLAPPLWLQRRLTGRGCRVGWEALAAFALVLAALTVPWYVAICRRVPGFARTFFWEHNVQRFLTGMAHPRGVWFYVPVVLTGLLPASLLAPAFLRFLLSGDEAVARRRTAELGFLLLAGGWVIAFFTASTCKLATYALPAFPPLALALGHYLAHSQWAASRWPGVAAGVAFFVLAGGHYVVMPWYAEYRSPLHQEEEVRRLCGDPDTPVVCYPRNCDSVAFYLGRADLRAYRSKEIEDLRALVRARPRTVVLCTHRHSLQGLRQLLPPEVCIVDEVRLELTELPGVPRRLRRPLALLMGETALGLGDVAVVEPRYWQPRPSRARSAAE